MVKMASGQAGAAKKGIPIVWMTPSTVYKMGSCCSADQLYIAYYTVLGL